MLTDGASRHVLAERHGNGNGKIQVWIGTTQDHHKGIQTATSAPSTTDAQRLAASKVSVQVNKFVSGCFKDLIQYWSFALAYPCTPQLFVWRFESFQVVQPPESVFAEPPFKTIPTASLTPYYAFPANKVCTTVD